jgi:LMBR1 domain-containing protein 1
MDALLIVLTVFFVLILLGVNIYLLALYIHTDDKGWGTAIYCKVLVVLGLTLCQAQALMVPLDVANKSALLPDSIDMASFWFFLYIIVLFFVVILLPFALFFY